jgi:hypothetical protein
MNTPTVYKLSNFTGYTRKMLSFIQIFNIQYGTLGDSNVVMLVVKVVVQNA